MKIKKHFIILLSVLFYYPAFSQGFITPLESNSLGLILNNDCTVKLVSGEEINGKFKGASIINGYLNNFSIKSENGEKIKFKPENVISVKVKTSELAKLTMMAESTSSIKEVAKSNFDEIADREYIIFETALRAKKKNKLRLMQLLNSGFDSQVKVYSDPNAKETKGIGVGGLKLTGGIDKSYLFVQNDEKAVLVKKGSYKKNFEELYSSCPLMLETFNGEKIKWNDVAGHVFAFDQACK